MSGDVVLMLLSRLSIWETVQMKGLWKESDLLSELVSR